MSNKKQFTIEKTGSNFTLKGITTGDTITIGKTHKKFKWISKNEGRVITITDTRWTSQKDYHGAYKSTVSRKKPLKVSLTKLDDLNVDGSLFQNMKTNSVFDEFASSDGGFAPGTNVMFTGSPGIGKTTVGIELLST